MAITTIEQLKDHLQSAIELEHSTIPTYLTAVFSIPQNSVNEQAGQIIFNIAVQEMLHMTLAANLLNAIGGVPQVNTPGFIPSYPAYLPDGETAFEANLMKFSPEAIQTFMEIEMPASQEKGVSQVPRRKREGLILAKGDTYPTIGEFYQAIKDGFIYLAERYPNELFVKDSSRQVTPDIYDPADGGEVIVVTDLKTALLAIDEIVEQGEGIHDSIWNGDDVNFHQPEQVAHYYRFQQIVLGRTYQAGDQPNAPTGPTFPVDWSQVYNIKTNTKLADLPQGSPAYEALEEFNFAYSKLLNTLHDAFNGQPSLLAYPGPGSDYMSAVSKTAAVLMQTPYPGLDGVFVGPSFEYIAATSSTNK